MLKHNGTTNGPAGQTPGGYSQAQIDKFILQRAAGELLPEDRVALCHKRIVAPSQTVKVFYREDRQRAHYSGLLSCERVWTCAVCASRISEHRRRELSAAIADHPEFVPVLATFTLSHHQGEGLELVLGRLAKAFRRFAGGRRWVALRAEHEIAGWIVTTEITHGANGWHPHYHVLFFAEWGADLELLPPAERDVYVDRRRGRLELDLWGHWRDMVTAVGGDANKAAFDVRQGNEAVAWYLAKYGRMPTASRHNGRLKWSLSDELTKSVVKRGRGDGRSPWQLLGDAAEGDQRARDLWLEYARVMKGKRLLRYSNGLRARLALSEAEPTAGELVTTEDNAPGVTLLAELSYAVWRCVVKNNARGKVLAIAQGGDRVALWDYLRSLPGYPELQRVNEHKGP